MKFNIGLYGYNDTSLDEEMIYYEVKSAKEFSILTNK